MTDQLTAKPTALQGSRCDHCDNIAYPVAQACQRCGAEGMRPIVLGPRGTVWGFTVQRFAPKSPPYIAPSGGFVPFAVGYVELPEGIKVEAVLDVEDTSDLEGHAVVELVADHPVPRFALASSQEL